MVLLHAFPLDGEMFEPQWTALAGRARFIVPDLRGFGGSGLVPGPSEMGAMADDVLALMDHLAIDAAVVGGVSMGGYVTLALLRNDPSRVRALVLADTQTSADDPAARERRETTARQVLARGLDGAPAQRRRAAWALRPGRAPGTGRGVDHRRLSRGPGGGTAGMALRPDARDILARFGGPLLVVVGATTSSPRRRRPGRWRSSSPGRSWWRFPAPGIWRTSSSRRHSTPRSVASSQRVQPPPAS